MLSTRKVRRPYFGFLIGVQVCHPLFFPVIFMIILFYDYFAKVTFFQLLLPKLCSSSSFPVVLCSRLNRMCCCSHSLRTPHRPRPSRHSGSASRPRRIASAARRDVEMVTWYPQQNTVGIFVLSHKSHYVNYAGFSMYRDTRTLDNLSSCYRPLRYILW